MDKNYLKRLYDLHKNDDKEKLQKIMNSPTSSKEAVFIAKQILNENGSAVNEDNIFSEIEMSQNNSINDDIHQIAMDIRFLKNIVVVGLIVSIIIGIISIF